MIRGSKIVDLHKDDPEAWKIKQIAEMISNGSVILYPSDTSYALACDLSDKNAIERIRRIRGLEKNQALTFICSSLEKISEFAKLNNEAFKTIKRLIPGPYTFVLPASNNVPRFAQDPKRKTAGIRIPESEITKQLINELDHPIISITATNEDLDNEEIIDRYIKLVDLVITSSDIKFTGKSTVIDMSTRDFEIIRRGAGIDDVDDLSF